MNNQTKSVKAFDYVMIALENIAEYNKEKISKLLDNAIIALEKATKEDPEYLDAIFYMGITLDLIGKPADAAILFEQILSELPEGKPRNEILYNLGVTYYHRYSHEHLQKAEKYFLEIQKTEIDDSLKYLALANLAQTYAMWMRPNTEQQILLEKNDSKESVFSHITNYFNEFKKVEKTVVKGFRKINNNLDKTKVQALLYNAKGMALMYYTDYISLNNKCDMLKDSHDNLIKSDKLYKDDWANICDLGSNCWRLGLTVKNEVEKKQHFDEAINYLSTVINKLRPNYGFALYELGNVYRTLCDFTTAIYYYDKALQIPEQYRDISTLKVNKEKAKANNKVCLFP
jgi:tetratricopeptide (TPR) repeat protein